MPIGRGREPAGGAGNFLAAGAKECSWWKGKSVTPLDQVGADIRTDKKQVLKQVLSPMPIVPSKRNIEIPGAKAVRRINSDRPEFYLREMRLRSGSESTPVQDEQPAGRIRPGN